MQSLKVRVSPASLRARVLAAIQRSEGRTATQLARALSADAASVSSLLNKLWHRHAVRRISRVGPRGGYGWYPR